MRYLTFDEILELHQLIINQSGGMAGVRDLGALKSATSQPYMTFDGEDLYPSILEKAAALGFYLISNHPFIDGNKRVGHATMETFLVLNGFEIDSNVDEQEQLILEIASGEAGRDKLINWLQSNIIKYKA